MQYHTSKYSKQGFFSHEKESALTWAQTVQLCPTMNWKQMPWSNWWNTWTLKPKLTVASCGLEYSDKTCLIWQSWADQRESRQRWATLMALLLDSAAFFSNTNCCVHWSMTDKAVIFIHISSWWMEMLWTSAPCFGLIEHMGTHLHSSPFLHPPLV